MINKLGLLLISFIVSIFLFLIANNAKGESSNPFEELDCLKPSINFWRSVYTEYGENQAIFFHDRTFEIYEIIDIPSFDNHKERRKTVRNAAAELEKILTKEDFSHLRVQIGVKERFLKGIEIGKKLIPQIQDQLITSNVPPDLAIIILIESSFQFNALSRVGARGPWQIMPGTLRMYSKASKNKLNDLKFSTKIAILILKDSYEATKSWSLAINAYHSGIGRLVDAEQQLHTKNICTIIDDYNKGAYKFASRNYYSQFLAAKRIYYSEQKITKKEEIKKQKKHKKKKSHKK